MLSSLSFLSLFCGIIYQFFKDLLCTEFYYIVLILLLCCICSISWSLSLSSVSYSFLPYVHKCFAVKASKLSIFVIVIFGLPNVHGCSFFISGLILQSCLSFVDLYSYISNIITTFHSLSNFSAVISEYFNIVLIILLLMFFFNIMQSIMCFFFLFKYFNLLFSICCLDLVAECYFDFLNEIISVLDVFFFFFHLVNLFLYINFYYALSKSSQYCSNLIFVAITLLLLRNNQISLHQFSNFVQLLLNHLRSETILLSITACTVSSCTTSIGTVKISSDISFVVLFLSEVQFLVIFNNFNISFSVLISMVFWLYLSILSIYSFYHNIIYICFICLIHSLCYNIILLLFF